MHTRNFIIFWYIVIYWEIKGETNLKIVQKFGRDHFRHFVGIGKKSSRSVFGIPIEIGKANNKSGRFWELEWEKQKFF